MLTQSNGKHGFEKINVLKKTLAYNFTSQINLTVYLVNKLKRAGHADTASKLQVCIITY